MYSANTWPIAANMLGFGNRAHDGGGHIKDAPAAVWASQLRQVRELGFDYIDRPMPGFRWPRCRTAGSRSSAPC